MFQEYLQSHLDRERLRKISDDCPEFEVELLHLFVGDSRCYLTQLKQAIGSLNLSAIEQMAHHIKGASANVGANRMQQLAAQLEKQAYQRQLHNPDRLLVELESSLYRIQQWIEQTIDDHRSCH